MSDATDIQEIKNLLYRYAELVDGGDFEAVGTLFDHATIDWGGTTTIGATDATQQFERFTRRYDDGSPKTTHVITNAIVTVDGDEAAARSRFTVLQATEALGLQPIITGRYEDNFERVSGEWRFERRRYVVDLTGDLSQHLL